MPAHIGTFGNCPSTRLDTQQTPKESILPTSYKNHQNEIVNLYYENIINRR